MELKDLLADSSKRTIDIAVSFVGEDPDLFQKVYEFALEDKGPLAMRAARVVSQTSLQYPEIFVPFVNDLIPKLRDFKTDGLKRELAKAISHLSLNIDEEKLSILLDTSFSWFNDPNETVAVKVYALDIIYRISEIYPELKPELIFTLENQMPRFSAGMKSRGKKMLNKLYREVESK